MTETMISARGAVVLTGILFAALARPGFAAPADAAGLASNVTIHRDEYGVAHIDGADTPSTVFGFAYAQAEDYFWQIEDSYIYALGRYAEINGERVIHNDLINRAFRIVPRAREDFEKLEPEIRALCEAWAAGVNHYLATHPEVKPRLIETFEGWHVIALARHLFLDFILMSQYVPRRYMDTDVREEIHPSAGSNAWAIGPERTKSGNAILFCNPHQPQFGYGQMYEAHLRSGDGWEFSGSTFFGSPLPSMGHNRHLGWTHTVNRPDIIDFWLVRFEDPARPDDYKFGDEIRTAESWTDTVRVKKGRRVEEQEFTFRSTVHGPIVTKLNDTDFIAMNVGVVPEAMPLGQQIAMIRATNLEEFREAMSALQLPFLNTVYADVEGNIYYLYNSAIPRRDPKYDWSGTLDGSDPGATWKGFHPLAELPQTLNPVSGYIQSCNSSPFVTTDDGNPFEQDYPRYMMVDAATDKPRAKVSRMILRELRDATFEDVCELAFDTRLYWPLTQLPVYRERFSGLSRRNPELAAAVKPYLDHLLDWDCVNTAECTQSTLVEEWYNTLYGTLYPPGGHMKPEYLADPDRQFQALIDAARSLEGIFGDWMVPWGDVHRLQRHSDVSDFLKIPFSDKEESLPCLGAPGPLGVVFTQFYTPSVHIRGIKEMKKRYAVHGTTYLAVFEFGKEGIRGRTLTHFGASNDPKSPHYMDQAKLHSERKMKPELFEWDEIRAKARSVYKPGEEPGS